MRKKNGRDREREKWRQKVRNGKPRQPCRERRSKAQRSSLNCSLFDLALPCFILKFFKSFWPTWKLYYRPNRLFSCLDRLPDSIPDNISLIRLEVLPSKEALSSAGRRSTSVFFDIDEVIIRKILITITVMIIIIILILIMIMITTTTTTVIMMMILMLTTSHKHINDNKGDHICLYQLINFFFLFGSTCQ